MFEEMMTMAFSADFRGKREVQEGVNVVGECVRG